MRLYKGILMSIILLIGCAVNKNGLPNGYDTTAVLLHLADNKQVDSIGFNLVKSIPELLYPRLLTGDLAIWEDSDKRTVVGSEQIIRLEKRATTPFVRGSDLFIHEYWSLFKKNFDFSIHGFTFSGKAKTGDVINYGYVDIKDVESLLKTEFVPTNANGPSRLTYWDALHSMKFSFNLVQFGGEKFQKYPRLSSLLQYQAVEDKKIYRELSSIENDKDIKYRVLSPDIILNEENKAFYSALQTAINDNKQIVLNAGGDSYFSHILFKPWEIKQVVVKEHWSKYKNIPFQQLISLELFIDKHAITVTKQQLEEMNVKINLQGLEEYLSEKRFEFLLEDINYQEIQPQQSERYYKALQTRDWNKITQ